MGHLLGCRAHAHKKVHSFLPKQEARWNMDRKFHSFLPKQEARWNMDRSIRAVGGYSFICTWGTWPTAIEPFQW